MTPIPFPQIFVSSSFILYDIYWHSVTSNQVMAKNRYFLMYRKKILKLINSFPFIFSANWENISNILFYGYATLVSLGAQTEYVTNFSKLWNRWSRRIFSIKLNSRAQHRSHLCMHVPISRPRREMNFVLCGRILVKRFEKYCSRVVLLKL